MYDTFNGMLTHQCSGKVICASAYGTSAGSPLVISSKCPLVGQEGTFWRTFCKFIELFCILNTFISLRNFILVGFSEAITILYTDLE